MQMKYNTNTMIEVGSALFFEFGFFVFFSIKTNRVVKQPSLKVAVNNPPITTVAKGRCTSAPQMSTMVKP
jgi:hypothetical protein